MELKGGECMKNTNQLIITIVLLIVVGTGAFYGGMQYQKMQRGNLGNGQFGGRNGQNGNNQAFRPIGGQITSVDDNSVTVKLSDGSSKIVLLSDKTTITEATSASKQVLASGKQITVFGTTNSDGSVTAQNIQLGQLMLRRMQQGQ